MRLPIEQDAVEGAGCDGLPFGQDVVQKIGGFDLRRERAGQVSSRLGDDRGSRRSRYCSGGGGLKRFGHDHDRGGWAQGRIKTDVAGSSRDGDAKVGVRAFVPDVVPCHRFVEERRPSGLGNRDVRPMASAERLKPSKMLIPHEDPAPIGANRFVDAITIEKTMIEDGDDGLFFFHKPIVEINPHRYACCNALKKACGFLERFLVFFGRIGIGDNSGSDLQIPLPPTPYQGSNDDIEIQVAVPADIPKRSRYRGHGGPAPAPR